MPRYVVTPGRTITRGSQPPLREGMQVTDDVLAEWGEAGLAANLEIGAVRDTEPALPRSRK